MAIVFKNELGNNEENTTEIKVATHPGVFHADDVLSIAVLNRVFDTVVVERIPDFKIDESYDLVIDLAKKFDDVRYFDHHQDLSFSYTEDKIKPCALSLISANLIERGFLTKYSEILTRHFWDDVIYPICVQDNGIGELLSKYPNLEFGWIHSMNPTWNDSITPDDAFYNAVKKAGEHLNILFKRWKSIEEGKRIWEEREVINNNINVPECYVPYQNYFDWEHDNSEFVISEDKDRGTWNLLCIPPTKEDWTNQRRSIPEAWLTNKPEGCSFVHKFRFIAAFNTKDNAINAALSIK